MTSQPKYSVGQIVTHVCCADYSPHKILIVGIVDEGNGPPAYVGETMSMGDARRNFYAEMSLIPWPEAKSK